MNRNILVGIAVVVIVVAAIAAYLLSQQPAATPTQPATTPGPTLTSPAPTGTPTTATQPATTPATSPQPSPTATAPATTTPQPTQTPTAQVTIRIWHALTPEEEAVFKEVAQRYMAAHPDVKIVLESKTDLQNTVLAGISSGEKFDLFIWAHDWIGLMVEAGAIKPIDDQVRDVLDRFAVPIPTYRGHVYGLPFTAETVALICNRRLVPQPPATFQDLVAVMRQFNRPPSTYGISYVVNPYFISAWIHGAGGYYFDDRTEKQGLTQPATLAGFQFFKREVMPYVAPNPTDYNTQVSLFLTNKTPCMVNGPWSIGAVKQAGLDFYVVPLPPVNSSFVPKPYGGLKMFYVTIYASPQAVEFVKWFTTDPQVAQLLVQRLGYVPVLKGVQVQDPVVAGFYRAVQSMTLMPVSPKMQPVWGSVDQVIQNAVVSDQATLQQAIQQAVQPLCQRGLC